MSKREHMLLIYAETYRGQTISYWYNIVERDFIYVDGMNTKLHHLGIVRSATPDLNTAIRNGRTQVESNLKFVEDWRKTRKSKQKGNPGRG